jgi:hypothetical protein
MEKIKQYIQNAGSGAALPTETLLRAFNSIFATRCLAAGAFTIPAGVTPVTASTVTVALIDGKVVTIAASTTTPAWTTAMSVAANSFLVVLTTVNAAGTMTNYVSNSPTAAAGLVFPIIPANEVVVGGMYLAPTATFTGGTTNLNAANINAVALNAVGAGHPTNLF